MMADRLIDDFAVPVEAAQRYREIFFLYPFFLEKSGQIRVRHVVLGDNNRAARIAVEPMYDSRPGGPAVRAQLAREAMRQRPDERSGPMAARRMYDHVGGLINHRHVVVFVEHVERNIFRNRGLARRFH